MKTYNVRFTVKDTGRSMIIGYGSARRAHEVVKLTATRHAAAETSAEYIGVSV